MLHALWDAGLTVGHAVRTAKECVRLANEDLKEKTAILDARYLCGDEKLYAELDKLLIAGVLNRNQDTFFKTKLEESHKRHAQYGDSIYLLEPQIKEGEGGLRIDYCESCHGYRNWQFWQFFKSRDHFRKVCPQRRVSRCLFEGVGRAFLSVLTVSSAVGPS